MNFVSSTENVMLKIGPTRITGAVMLDQPADLQLLAAKLQAIVARTPRLRSIFTRKFFWHVRESAEFDIRSHLAVLHDDTIAGPADLERILEHARRLDLSTSLPPWQMIAVNPSSDGEGGSLRSAVIFHFDHAIADGIRALEIATRLAADPAVTEQAASASPIDTDQLATFHDLPLDPGMADLRVVCVHADISEMKARRREGCDLSDQVIEAIDTVLNDEALFDQSVANKGKVALVRLTRRQVGAGELGNYVSAVDRDSASREAQATTRRGMLPSLKAERTTQARQIWMAPLPGSLTKAAARQWYNQFDALLTIIPGGRNTKEFAGAGIEQVYGVAPALMEIPLNIAAVTYGNTLSLTLLASDWRFTGNKDLLRQRFHDALFAKEAEPA